ncbi:MAG: hypothetical protein K0R18_1095 [Bacillales bacterium]|jgi:hypothetical protein|nr:hypothetical protein [Bacillales bacterium]
MVLMQFIQLVEKAKSSSVLIILLLLIWAIVAINSPKTDGSKEQEKKQKSGIFASEYKKSANDLPKKILLENKNFKPNDLLLKGKLVDFDHLEGPPETKMHTETYVLPYFNSTVQLPIGWYLTGKISMGDALSSVIDPSKYPILTAKDEEGNEIIFKAIQYKNGGRHFLDNYQVGIDDINHKQGSGLVEVKKSTDVIVKLIHNQNYFMKGFTLSDHTYNYHYVAEFEDFILHWSLTGSNSKVNDSLERFLQFSTIGKVAQIETKP